MKSDTKSSVVIFIMVVLLISGNHYGLDYGANEPFDEAIVGHIRRIIFTLSVMAFALYLYWRRRFKNGIKRRG